ncbi:MAG: protease pro-enzyme activation domain-containing protein [Candidatus Velthaea sp.]
MNDSSNAAAGRVSVPGTERRAPAGAVAVGPADPNERTSVTIVVRPRTASWDEAAALAALPPARRHYLTREEFAERHGADPADLMGVERFALDAGLLVIEASAARRSVIVEGTIAQLNAAFGTEVRLFRAGSATFRCRAGTLSVPAHVAPLVHGIFGLDERPQARAHFRRNVRPAAAANVSYTPLQVARAYQFPTGVDGTGQTIALIELGGGFTPADLQAYFQAVGVPPPVVTSVGVDGGANAPDGNPNGADAEVMLDIEVAGAVAPGAKIVVYFAPNTDQGFLDAVTTAVHDTANRPAVVSISWGAPESDWTAQAMQQFDAAFADAATMGVTVCCASGDNGSGDGVTDGKAHVDFPSSSAHVLGCGGTTLHVNGTAIASESVWNDGATGGATGGGVSDTFALPNWQKAAGVPPSSNPGAHVGRGVPDVAGDADPQTGYVTRVDGSDGVIGGTSAVAPLWAALAALLNQQLGKPVGFVNAQLYAHASGAFRDITSGNNGAYRANTGWDACTGLGSPNGTMLAKLLTAG